MQVASAIANFQPRRNTARPKTTVQSNLSPPGMRQRVVLRSTLAWIIGMARLGAAGRLCVPGVVIMSGLYQQHRQPPVWWCCIANEQVVLYFVYQRIRRRTLSNARGRCGVFVA